MKCHQVLLSVSLALIAMGSVHAAIFQVTNVNDSGPGSLREAIELANANGEPDTIEFLVTGTIVLQSNLPILSESLVIQGSGTNDLIIDGNQDYRPFRLAGISGSSYVIEDLTLRNGFSNDTGGAIVVLSNASLILNRCIVEDSAALEGGGIAAFGPIQITDTIVRANQSGFGGGILLDGASHSIKRSSVLLNFSGIGGGIYVGPAALVEIENVTVAGNSASNDAQSALGGGLAVVNGSAMVRHSTFALNRADSGAGVAFVGTGSAQEFANNILHNNLTWSDGMANCSGVLPNDFANLSSDGSCQLFGASDLQFVDPLLDDLDFYGGPTPSFLPRPGSLAVNSADNSLCASHDQRNRPRPDSPGGNCDRGAVEVYPDDDYPEDVIFSDRFE
jgi:hypothetical protein